MFLLTGGQGQIGFELAHELAALGTVVAPSSSELDLRDARSIAAAVSTVRPTVIVNAAAWTAVDAAESDPDSAAALNAESPGALARHAARTGAVLVHFSTDYVFDGTSQRPWLETDTTNPLSVYGRTKLAGERAIVDAGCRHLIFRTSWVFSRRRQNFMLTMLRLARTREELAVVADQRGAPTSARLIANAVARVIAPILHEHGDGAADEWSGVYHLSAAGETTWHGFAEAVLAGDPNRAEQVCRHIRALTTADYPTAARRPAYSVLDNAKVERVFGVRLPDWREHLRQELAATSPRSAPR